MGGWLAAQSQYCLVPHLKEGGYFTTTSRRSNQQLPFLLGIPPPDHKEKPVFIPRNLRHREVREGPGANSNQPIQRALRRLFPSCLAHSIGSSLLAPAPTSIRPLYWSKSLAPRLASVCLPIEQPCCQIGATVSC